jgi:hypothetical protein
MRRLQRAVAGDEGNVIIIRYLRIDLVNVPK